MAGVLIWDKNSKIMDFLNYGQKMAPEQKIKNQASLHLMNFDNLTYETDFSYMYIYIYI